MKKWKVSMLMMAVVLMPVAAWATAIPITNPSFEDPVLAEGGTAYYNTPGWLQLVGGVIGTYNPTAGQADGSDGQNVEFAYGAVGNGSAQDLGVNYVAGNTYTLTAKMSRPGQYYDWNVPSDTVLKISLNYADTGAEIAAHTETIWITDPAWGHMLDYSVVYTATAADAAHGIRVRLSHMSGDGGYFDDVRLDVVSVPEPATLGLLCLGGVMTIIRRKSQTR